MSNAPSNTAATLTYADGLDTEANALTAGLALTYVHRFKGHGGKKAIAVATGVSMQTMHNWCEGQGFRPTNVAKVATALTAHLNDPAKTQALFEAFYSEAPLTAATWLLNNVFEWASV